ncbi:MAG: molybdopterin converting factor subunit 1 [Planctomycetota bacterium]|nr:MAG: molybdopterin converting factor subunit 1 [Planctomycetota bacterium]
MPLELGVKLFASVREAMGRDAITVELEDGACVADLLDALAARHPEISAQRAALSVAVNHEFARPDRRLAAGDEVALIPPVGGG